MPAACESRSAIDLAPSVLYLPAAQKDSFKWFFRVGSPSTIRTEEGSSCHYATRRKKLKLLHNPIRPTHFLTRLAANSHPFLPHASRITAGC